MLLLILGQKVLFCLELGRREQGSGGRAGPGVPAPLHAGRPRWWLQAPILWTPSFAHTSRVAGMGDVPRGPGLARRGQAKPPIRSLLGASRRFGGPRAVKAVFRRVLRCPRACGRLRECSSETQTAKTEGRELSHFLH